jgi:HAMP domain-containing protein
MTRRTLIATQPAVSLADLTVDQIAGSYLEADVYARYAAQSGATVQLSVALAADCHEAAASLRAYAIEPTLIEVPEAGQRLARGLLEAGTIEVRDTAVVYAIETGTYPDDAAVSGSCPSCLAAASGGACDGCGAHNRGCDLLGVDSDRYALRTYPRLLIDLERFRPGLECRLAALATPRPAFARAIDAALGRPLAPFVLGRTLEAELSPAVDSFAVQQAALERAGEVDDYVLFVDLASAYVHALVHGALGAPAPRAIFTSCVQPMRPNRGARNLIWARELTDVFSADAVRLYLALTGPDHAEAHFVRSVMNTAIEHVAASIDRLVRQWNRSRHHVEARRAQYEPRDIAQCMGTPLPLAAFTGAELARRTLHCIDHLAQKASRPRAGFTAYIPSVLALALEPFCPRYVAEVRARFPEAARRWSELRPCKLEADLPRFDAFGCDGACELARVPLTATGAR